MGIRKPAELVHHSMRGPLFETWVLGELLKHRTNRGQTPNAWFWRGRNGLEVDCVLDRDGRLRPVEIKSGRTVGRDFLGSLVRFRELAGNASENAFLVYGGDRLERRTAATVLPWRDIGELTAHNEE